MLNSIRDFPDLQRSDADAASNARGWWRVGRRMLKRCWLDQATIQQPRIFCQNSGGCGSTYVAHLLKENNVKRCFHEKSPDLLKVGLDHYENRVSQDRLVRLLRYTRHDAFFEANNRLFSLSCELAKAFPNSRYIHLHRDAAESVRAGMSKQDLASYVASDIRFQGTLAGPHDCGMFERFCFHWANMNRRLHEDLSQIATEGFEVVSLKFENLVDGKVQPLEESIGQELRLKKLSAVNVRPTRSSGRFAAYPDWNGEQKRIFDRICGPVMALLGR